MSGEVQMFLVNSQRPPVIEVDSEAKAIYVRFRNSKVARTVGHPGAGMFCAVDLDGAGQVVGVEAVGFDGMRLDKVFAAARVQADHIDFSRATIRPTAGCAT